MSETLIHIPELGWQAAAWTQHYKGIKYKEMGKSSEGVYCWGLVWLIYQRELALDVGQYGEVEYTTKHKQRQYVQSVIEAEAACHWVQVAGAEPTNGKNGYHSLVWTRPRRMFDVILFKMGGFATHVGVLCSRQHFIHIIEGTQVTIEELGSPSWVHRQIGVYRHLSMSMSQRVQGGY